MENDELIKQVTEKAEKWLTPVSYTHLVFFAG